MSVQSEIPCWEIIQCNKKETCLFAENDKKSCWEMVGNDDACSFHVCIDCLVYLAKHKDSPLTKETFRYILNKRKNIVNNIVEYGVTPALTVVGPTLQAKDTFNTNVSHSGCSSSHSRSNTVG
jgi:hypothetical protein